MLTAAGFDLVTARGAVARLLGAPHPDADSAALASIGVDLDASREAVEATLAAVECDAAPPLTPMPPSIYCQDHPNPRAFPTCRSSSRSARSRIARTARNPTAGSRLLASSASCFV
ncbi:hypothetical protein, partial [Saccharothrix sp. ST-888]|uniref:hypothetical protein n=1 Tax=Saccharothrix sp. ST-888 TaxID=1427391 RepID=UPI003FA723B6